MKFLEQSQPSQAKGTASNIQNHANRYTHGINQPSNKTPNNKDPLFIKVNHINELLGKVIENLESPSQD